MIKRPANKKIFRKLLWGGGLLILSGMGIYFYYATLTYEDTASLKAEYNFHAGDFIREFENNNREANRKYAEKIIAISGLITATESAGTTINIKMEDKGTGSYIIFAFQEQHLAEARSLHAGDSVTIKGSCSDGIFSEILGSYFISFKRSTLTENFN